MKGKWKEERYSGLGLFTQQEKVELYLGIDCKMECKGYEAELTAPGLEESPAFGGLMHGYLTSLSWMAAGLQGSRHSCGPGRTVQI